MKAGRQAGRQIMLLYIRSADSMGLYQTAVRLILPKPRAPVTPGSTAGAEEELLPSAEQGKVW